MNNCHLTKHSMIHYLTLIQLQFYSFHSCNNMYYWSKHLFKHLTNDSYQILLVWLWWFWKHMGSWVIYYYLVISLFKRMLCKVALISHACFTGVLNSKYGFFNVLYLIVTISDNTDITWYAVFFGYCKST